MSNKKICNSTDTSTKRACGNEISDSTTLCAAGHVPVRKASKLIDIEELKNGQVAAESGTLVLEDAIRSRPYEIPSLKVNETRFYCPECRNRWNVKISDYDFVCPVCNSSSTQDT